MTCGVRRPWPAVVLLGLAAFQASALGQVKDAAGFFKPETVQKADQLLGEIKDRYHKDVVIETIKTVPADQAEKVRRMDRAERSRFFQEWTERQAEQEGVHGIYVLICKSPGHLQAGMDRQTARRAFTRADRDRLVQQMLPRFNGGQYDEALLDGITFIRDRLRANRGESEDVAALLAEAKVEQYVPAPAFAEGPTWRDGELFFCSDGLLRVTRERQVRKYLDLQPAGTYLRGDGHILICDNKLPALLDLSPDGKVGVVVDQFDGKKLNSLNDLTVDAAGNVYWTDPNGSSRENPAGKVFRVRPDGRVDLIAANLAFPNGIEVDPGSKYLYVVESQTGKVLRYDLPADDQPLGPPVVFFALGGSGGDGCAFDAAGNLWVADFHRPETGRGRITVLGPKGTALGHLDVPAGQVSNLTFGGPGLDEVLITTGEPAAVFRARVGVAGFRGHPGKELKVLRTLDLKPLDEPVGGK